MSPLDPERRFQNETSRRLPQVEFGARIPVFRARRSTTFQTLGSGGAETDLTWNIWENGDERTFDPRTAAGAVPTLGTDLVRYVNLLLPGEYEFLLQVSVQTLAAGSTITLVLNDGWDGPNVMPQPTAGGSGGYYTFPASGQYPTVYFLGQDAAITFPPWAQISWDVAQDSGVDRNTTYGTMFTISYRGPISLEEFTG